MNFYIIKCVFYYRSSNLEECVLNECLMFCCLGINQWGFRFASFYGWVWCFWGYWVCALVFRVSGSTHSGVGTSNIYSLGNSVWRLNEWMFISIKCVFYYCSSNFEECVLNECVMLWCLGFDERVDWVIRTLLYRWGISGGV